MKKKLKIAIALVVIIVIAIIVLINCLKDSSELQSIKSKSQLMKIYKEEEITDNIFFEIATLPWSIITNIGYARKIDYVLEETDNIIKNETFALDPSKTSGTSSSKDYSTTNIQVENVDEADVTKTDGDYIYSISDSNIIITDVRNPENLKITATIQSNDDSIPNDMILTSDKLTVISTKFEGNRTGFKDTVVKVYDIENKENPKILKQYELYEAYYTSRCIGNMLYVIASGNLRKEGSEIITYYKEDGIQKDIGYKNIKYLKDVKSSKQTLISAVDLDKLNEDISINSYLLDISNAYVSENSIYLLNQKYESENDVPPISSLFGIKGAIGPFKYNEDYKYTYYTEIYKFDIKANGQIEYKTKTKIEGKTINQYSLDELDGHIRVALYDDKGARIAIFDENLKQIGISDYVAKGETMYSSRFIGEKAYLVTYQNMDPLFVFDLSDETKPKALGELKIPGYSTYLHPYDDNHIIGIGMETEETVRRDSSGKVISRFATIVGMKMALFDVSDVNNPITLSSTIIGDRRTTSAILTNPKALLFSKERNLIAIPVNNYSEDFTINNISNSISGMTSNYINYNKPYISEGYLVYDITLDNGFKQKGLITHNVDNNDIKYKYNYNTKTALLRGLYIEEDLYTVSENAIKVHKLDSLEQVSELNIRRKK